MNKYVTGALIIAVALGLIWYITEITPGTGDGVTPPAATPASKDDLIVVTAPLPNAEVASPLTVTGRARGNWYFEADFPVKILDANGRQLGIVPAHAEGEWMTTEYVPFSATLPFETPTTATGTLVLEKDNPSGLPEHANELRIPIRFANVAKETRTIQLYYYDAARDQGPGGAQCTRAGLVAVPRTLPRTLTPLRDSIVELMQGRLTEAERAQGLITEFPLAGVTLKNITLVDGVATLTFDDPQGSTSGGSCRVGILWHQIEATAKQFPTVQSVRFLPEDLFQP